MTMSEPFQETLFDATALPSNVITGGFPCQEHLVCRKGCWH